VLHWSGGKWAADATPGDLPSLAGLRMLPDSNVPRLWLEPATGPDRVLRFGSKPAAFQLQAIPGGTPADRAVTLAVGRLRMAALVNGKLMAQDFNPDTGATASKEYEIALPASTPVGQFHQFQVILVSTALLFAIFASMRQRPAMRSLAAQMENIRVAPLGRRALAGLIDAAPVILAVTAALWRYRDVQLVPNQEQNLLALIIYWSGGIFYILYTTVIEAVAGRSLGKMLLGLRVIGLDGQPASAGALVTRNVLRLIEVGLFFFPLLLLPFLPLRQRAGDVAAGTLVVTA
ncbi:MAG TPA: RDD family protein, partial [Tepidisphaeraceae bacterium]|nr:RDD family protein [Tepidisphaeraceae bacterium]